MNEFLFVLARGEFHLTFDECVDRMVFADPDVLTGMVLRSALTDNDIAGDDSFATEFFYTEALAMRLASVLGTTGTFFMSHDLLFLS